MKNLIISSNSSGGGKTTVTLGLMKAFKNRGFQIQGYKVGPDYIDPAFHSHVTGKSSRNLDMYLMGDAGVKASLSRGSGDLGIIEGVMGLYDGKGIDTEYSTAHLAKVLDLPVILVISPKAQSATLCAELKGIKEFEDIKIAGVILNNISEGYYRLLKLAIEKNCSMKVFGYVPSCKELSLKSRHLGLVQSSELEGLDEKIDLCAGLLEEHVDLDAILESFKEIDSFEDKFHVQNIGIRTAIAYDKAFSFYYKENIELFKEAGEVVFFSPLKDEKLPENIDFLYIGGGYPEVFANELSSNSSMLCSIKQALENGLSCYAECGGLMYLTEGIEDNLSQEDKERYFNKTVGFLNGKAVMTKGLQNFGYATIEVEKDNKILGKGLSIKCHEFHKSYVQLEDSTIYHVYKDMYDGNKKTWKCGYVKNNTLGAYAHVHFFGNIDIFKELTASARRK